MSQENSTLGFTLIKVPLTVESPEKYGPNSLLILPGDTRKNTSDTTLYGRKSDSNTFADRWAAKGKAALSLPADVSLDTAKINMKAVWEAVGAGFKPVLPLVPFNPDGPFANVGEKHLFTDEEGKRWEPDFGPDTDKLDEAVAGYYLSNLKLLSEFVKNPENPEIREKIKKISPELWEAYEKGQRQKNLPILDRNDEYLLPLIKEIKYAKFLTPKEKKKLSELINKNKITEAFRDNFHSAQSENNQNLNPKIAENEKLLRKFFPIQAFVLDFIKTKNKEAEKDLPDIYAVLILFEQGSYTLALDNIKNLKASDYEYFNFLAKFKKKIECESSVVKKMVYDQSKYIEKYELNGHPEEKYLFIKMREKLLESVDAKNPAKILAEIKELQIINPKYAEYLSELKKNIECEISPVKAIIHEAFEGYLPKLIDESDISAAQKLLDILLKAESPEKLNKIITQEIQKLHTEEYDGFRFEINASKGLLLTALNDIYKKTNPHSRLLKSFYKGFDLYFSEKTFQKMKMELEALLILKKTDEFNRVIQKYRDSHPKLAFNFEKFTSTFNKFNKYGIDYKEKKESIQAIVNATGKTKQQKAAETINLVTGKIDQGYLAMVLTLLSNVGKASKEILLKNAHYLFPVSFVFKAIDFISYAVKFYAAPNKNLGRFTDLLIKIAETAVIGFATFGAAVLAPVIIAGASIAVGPLTFSVLIGATFLYNIGRQVYFLSEAYQAYKQGDKETSKIFREKAKETGKNIVMLAFVLVTLITCLAIPPVGIVMSGVVGGVAIAAVGVVLASAILRGTPAGDFLDKKIIKPVANFLKRLIGRDPDNTLEAAPHANPSERAKAVSHNQSEVKIEKSLGLGGYNNHSALHPLPLEADKIVERLALLKKNIAATCQRIDNQIKQARGSVKEDLWSENPKRQQKLTALEFLQDIVTNHFLKVIKKLKEDNIDKKPFEYNGKILFEYTNMQDFIDNMDQYVLEKGEKTYQSFSKDIGEVQSHFRESYQLLLTLYHLPTDEQAIALKKLNPQDIASTTNISPPANEPDVVEGPKHVENLH